MTFAVESKERLPDWTEERFERFRMNQLTQILERRFSAIEEVLVDTQLRSNGSVGGDAFAPLVHEHGISEIVDFPDDNMTFTNFASDALLENLSNVHPDGGEIPNDRIIKYSKTAFEGEGGWVLDDLSQASSSLASLVDTDIDEPIDGAFLVYDDDSNTWVDSDVLPYILRAGDTMDGNLNFPDSVRARFGDALDGNLYWNGADLIFSALTGSIRLQVAGTEDGLVVTSDGAVAGYFDGFLAHQSSDNGIDIFDPDGNFPVVGGYQDDGVTQNWMLGNLGGATGIRFRSLVNDESMSFQTTDPVAGVMDNISIVPATQSISFQMATAAGAVRTLAVLDADTSFDFYTGDLVALRGNNDGAIMVGTTTNNPLAGGNQNANLLFSNQNFVQCGEILWVDSPDMEITNNTHGGAVIIAAENAAGASRVLFSGDPDTRTEYYHPQLDALAFASHVNGLEVFAPNTGDPNVFLLEGVDQRADVFYDIAANELNLRTEEAGADFRLGLRNAGDSAYEDAIRAVSDADVILCFNGLDALRTADHTLPDHSSAAEVEDSTDSWRDVGYNEMPENPQTGTTYTIVKADTGHAVTMDNASPNTATLPNDANIKVGALGSIVQKGAGATSVATASGVTMNFSDGTSSTAKTVTINNQFAWVNWWKTGDTEYYVTGAAA